MTRTDTDVVVIGGGIVGLAVSHSLLAREPRTRIVVLEKEGHLAAHQTGRNSGVIHSGIYYKPGSRKAEMAVAGAAAMERFAAANDVPYDRCGKVIVATQEWELAQLDSLHRRGIENGVPSERIGPERLCELEPHAAGLAALHVPSTGIIDYVRVCEVLCDDLLAHDGEVRLRAPAASIAERDGRVDVTVGESGTVYTRISARAVVNCAGLQSDRVATMSGDRPDVRIIPFRGEYYEIVPQRSDLVRNLIYPVPDPSFPFLGVHFTRMVGGGLECGPNAVLALAREGYTWGDVKLRDVKDTLAWRGFWTLARKYWRTGAGEVWRSISKAAFVKALQRLVPDVTAQDLVKAPAGVRAQALRLDGALVDDFAIDTTGHVVNVLNAPSPAATASLVIGEEIASVLIDRVRT